MNEDTRGTIVTVLGIITFLLLFVMALFVSAIFKVETISNLTAGESAGVYLGAGFVSLIAAIVLDQLGRNKVN